MPKEEKAELKERFIMLRAEGRSFANISDILGVSKPTLVAWARELEMEITNAKSLRLDELFETYYVGKLKRIEAFGKRLEAILTELDTRDLKDVPTPMLLSMALKYGERLAGEESPLLLQGETKKTLDEGLDALNVRTETWWI
jgi:hypothetical protein